MTLTMISALVVSFLFSSVFGKYYIPWLRRQKAGQEILGYVEWHMNKSGTPTMGGVMFILGTLLACMTAGFPGMLKGDYRHLYVFCFALIFGGIGFLDDWEKLRHKANLGLTAKQKFLLQLAAALLFVILMRYLGIVRTEVYVPFWNTTVNIPDWLYFALAAFIIVGTVNAVNITDGVDGLSSASSIPVFLFYVAMAFYWGERYVQLGVFASGMVGGLLGFLIYNFNPAKVFMGDTGSLFMGGAIAALAFAYDMPLVLVTLGIIFIIETLSDIIQVSYFKLTHGKRVFKMAPFHHHLEMGGWTGKKWSEKELFVLFGGVSTLFAIISFFGVSGRVF